MSIVSPPPAVVLAEGLSLVSETMCVEIVVNVNRTPYAKASVRT